MSLIKEDHLFGKIAVLNNFITEEQLQEALQIQNSNTDLLSLPLILLRLGYISNEQFRDILETQKRRMPRPAVNPQEKKEDLVFSYLAVRNSYAEEEEVNKCLTQQAFLARRGLLFRLSEIMVVQKVISLLQAEKLIAEQESLIVACPNCGLRYNMLGLQTEQFICKRCGDMVQISASLLKNYSMEDLDNFQIALQQLAQESQNKNQSIQHTQENQTFNLFEDEVDKFSVIAQSHNEDGIEEAFPFTLGITDTSEERDTEDVEEDEYILAGNKNLLSQHNNIKSSCWQKTLYNEYSSSSEDFMH